MATVLDINEQQYPKAESMNPKKFAFWLGLVSIIMFFAPLTSAYIVRKADPGWLEFDMPSILLFSTLVILLSSVSMQMAYKAAMKNEYEKLKLFIGVTTLLGIAFVVLQFMSYEDLIARKLFVTGPGSNVAVSFLYILIGAHVVHIFSALIFLLIVAGASFKRKINSDNTLMIDTCTTYWHFLGLLWVYLFGFLYIS